VGRSNWWIKFCRWKFIKEAPLFIPFQLFDFQKMN
jgi:hypothetical protein